MASKDKKQLGMMYAFHGIIHVFKYERNFRIQIAAFFCIIIASFFFKLVMIEWITVILVSGFVLATEMVNSVVERMIDYIKPDIHPAAKVIKDVAAGAVLISAITAFIVGCILFIPKIIQLF